MTDKKLKGVYLIEPSVNEGWASPGVISKIEAQIQTLKNAGFEMEKYTFKSDITLKGKILRRLPFTNQIPKWDYSYDYKSIDFVYLRKPVAINMAFRRYMKSIKKQNPKIRIIMEIPTYPYDGELLSDKRDFPLFVYDRIGRRYLKNKIDRIALLNDGIESLFGVPVVRFMNGMDTSGIRLHIHQTQRNRLDLCCVANLSFWHGFDRLIRGLYDYYKSYRDRKIFIHIVGEGAALDELVGLVKEKELQEYVLFYGKKNREEIADIYDKCDVGVGSLAVYRIGVRYVCSLKNKEYTAAGMPLITGSSTDVGEIKGLCRFVCEFPNDDSNIDMERICSFYDSLLDEYGGDIMRMSTIIREETERRFNMDSAMKSVVEYIQSCGRDKS